MNVRTFTQLIKGAAGVILAAFSIASHAADPTCPSGQSPQWTVGGTTSAAGTYPTSSAAKTAISSLTGQSCKQGSDYTSYTYQSPSYYTDDSSNIGAHLACYSSQYNIEATGDSLNITATSSCTNTPPPTCTAGEGGYFGDNGSSIPATMCLGGCSYNRVGNGVVMGQTGSQLWTAGFISTGQNCSGSSSATSKPTTQTTPDGQATISPAPETNCIVINGEKTCIAAPDQKNCGTVNGEHYCTTDHNCGYVNGTYECGSTLGAGQCITTKSGAGICVSTPTKPVQSPPGPDNGTKGTNAQPTITFVNTGNTNTTVNYYGGGSMAASTNHPAQGSSTNNSQSPSDPTKTGCGAEGQAPCKQKIDETGTPSFNGDFSDKDPTDKTDDIKSVAQSSPLSGLNLPSSSQYSIPNGTCQSITSSFQFHGTRSFVFPGDAGCQKIEIIKSVLAWCIGVVTFVFCYRRFINEI